MTVLRCLAGLVAAAAACAQAPLQGVIDFHVHADPDSLPRSIDAIDLARLAKQRGMRGLVLKNHYEPTASLAYVVRKEVPGIEVFGGIDLNRTVGGINPAAVERMTMVKGGWGRVVWLPTFDAENQVRYSGEARPFVSVAKRGGSCCRQCGGDRPRRRTRAYAGNRAFRRQGVAHVVVTHAMLPPVKMTAQMRAAAEGAFLEFVHNGLIGPNKSASMRDYAEAIRQVGPRSCILASDLGQPGNPLHPDGLAAFFAGLMGAVGDDLSGCTHIPPR